jgi:hypothetical protein
MRPKFLLSGILIFSVCFIALGDRILPHPLSDASRNIRASINQSMRGLFPQSRTAETIEQREENMEKLLEQKTPSNSK